MCSLNSKSFKIRNVTERGGKGSPGLSFFKSKLFFFNLFLARVRAVSGNVRL